MYLWRFVKQLTTICKYTGFNVKMNCKERVFAVYFSPTHTTEKVVESVAAAAASELGLPMETIDLTTPENRRETLTFRPTDLVIFGVPVYIGRVPNLIAPYFRTIKGGGACVAAIAVYGNRAYDDALAELLDILEEDGFRPVAAGAFIGEHSFSTVLGGGRPDREDLDKANGFGKTVAGIATGHVTGKGLDGFPGRKDPERNYYAATDGKGKKIDIRKVKPVTDMSLCDNCGYCATVCSMGAIDPADCSSVPGICIKCSACVKLCPKHAKSFTDPEFLGHLRLLEEKFTYPRKEPEIFY